MIYCRAIDEDLVGEGNECKFGPKTFHDHKMHDIGSDKIKSGDGNADPYSAANTDGEKAGNTMNEGGGKEDFKRYTQPNKIMDENYE